MDDTLGLLEEALQVCRDIGYAIREEPLGDLPGGPCVVRGTRTMLLNMQSTALERLAVLLAALAADPESGRQPMSRKLAARLRDLRPATG